MKKLLITLILCITGLIVIAQKPSQWSTATKDAVRTAVGIDSLPTASEISSTYINKDSTVNYTDVVYSKTALDSIIAVLRSEMTGAISNADSAAMVGRDLWVYMPDSIRKFTPSSAEFNIAALYNNVLAWYDLNEATVIAVKDSSVNGLDGTNNGAEVGFTGALDDAYWFLSVDDVSVADNDLFSFGNGTTDVPFSMTSLVRTTSLVGNNAIDAKTNEYALIIKTDGTVLARLYSGGSTPYIQKTSTTVLSTSTWYKVDVTYDGSGTAAGIKIYIDGTEDTGTTGVNGTYVAMTNTTNTFNIGEWNGGNNFQGQIDFVRIFDTELPASTISLLYNGGSYTNWSSIKQ